MSQLITKKFRVNVAEQLRESFTEIDSNQYYVFLSGITPWANEASPPTSEDTIQYTDYDIWRGMTGLKKVSNNDVTLAIPRYNWANNNFYAQYDNIDPALYTKRFYVITDDNNIYKCLSNSRGANSTVKPTGTSTSVIETADGYQWKFMYNITGADNLKYISLGFIPVKTLIENDNSPQFAVQQVAANGSILTYDVVANGSGYLHLRGSFDNVINSSSMVLAANAIGTDGAYEGSTLYISSGLGTGQIRDIVGYGATNRTVTLRTGFTLVPNTSSLYHIGPKINILGDGENAAAYANVINGTITKVNRITSGRKYSRAHVTVTANTNYGSGAIVKGYVAPPGGHGSDPVHELGGSNITVSVGIDGDEGGKISANNNFRIIGLLKDPLNANGTLATSLRYNQTTRLTLTSISGTYLQDEFVNGSTSLAKGRIVQFANTNGAGTSGVLSLVNVEGNFTNTETITANTSTITAVINGITLPELRPFTGKVLYALNRVALDRDIDQTEQINLTVKF